MAAPEEDRAVGFGPLEGSSVALLTTFRPGGEPVATPLSVAVVSGRAYFVTPAGSGKARRLAHTPRVTLAPCTIAGRVTGETVAGLARRLDGEERRRAARGLLRPTGSLFWSLVMYRLQGHAMLLFEVVPDHGPGPAGGPVTSRG
jgi:PPOX class probable F420-dependent enzyme